MVGKASVPGQWRFSCVRFARMPGLATTSAPYGLITRPPSVLTRIWGKKAGTLIGYLSRMWPSSQRRAAGVPLGAPRGNLSRGWRSERRLPHVLARRKSRCCLVHDCGRRRLAPCRRSRARFSTSVRTRTSVRYRLSSTFDGDRHAHPASDTQAGEPSSLHPAAPSRAAALPGCGSRRLRSDDRARSRRR